MHDTLKKFARNSFRGVFCDIIKSETLLYLWNANNSLRGVFCDILEKPIVYLRETS